MRGHVWKEEAATKKEGEWMVRAAPTTDGKKGEKVRGERVGGKQQ